MINSLQGGYIYPQTSFIFDKIYNNYKEALIGVGNGDVLVGRYVLVCYSEPALDANDRFSLETNGTMWGNIAPSVDNGGQAYLENFNIDNDGIQNKISNDRKIYRVKYIKNVGDTEYSYGLEEITNLNINISDAAFGDLKETLEELIEDLGELGDINFKWGSF